MNLLSPIIGFLIGLALIVFGAEALVDASSAIARKMGVSEFVIGLTIVALGTSLPELTVSLVGAIGGNADIAVGNVVGSNIINVLLCLSVTALIMPINLDKGNKTWDAPVNIAVTLLLILLGMSGRLLGLGGDRLCRSEGLIMLVLLVVFLHVSFKRKTIRSNADEHQALEEKNALEAILAKNGIGTGISVGLILLGLAALVWGGKLFVGSATTIAREVGVSDKFIAIIMLAGGTSMPELATCIAAAAKKKSQLALGNILGSNIFNILLILGLSSVIHPLSMQGMGMVDMAVLLLSSILVIVSCWTGRNDKIDRVDACIMLAFEIAYVFWLAVRL